MRRVLIPQNSMANKEAVDAAIRSTEVPREEKFLLRKVLESACRVWEYKKSLSACPGILGDLYPDSSANWRLVWAGGKATATRISVSGLGQGIL